MLEKLSHLLKTKEEKSIASAEQNFDELMGKVDENQKDLTQLEHHIRDEWTQIQEEIDDVTEGVDDLVNKETA